MHFTVFRKKKKKKNGLKYPCCTTATVVKIILRCTYGLEIIHYEVWRVIVILRAQKKKKRRKTFPFTSATL